MSVFAVVSGPAFRDQASWRKGLSGAVFRQLTVALMTDIIVGVSSITSSHVDHAFPRVANNGTSILLGTERLRSDLDAIECPETTRYRECTTLNVQGPA
jgi:hypothetical protein